MLALSVVAGHSQTFYRGFLLINAKAAVVCFFIISGFYMALVLDRKYRSVADFLLSRWLRIYTPYIVVTLIAGAVLYALGMLRVDWISASFNVTLLGQDWSHLYLIHPMGPEWIVIPQAWSLAIELEFYAIAALLFRSPLMIGAAFIAGFIVQYNIPTTNVMVAQTVFVYFAAGGIAYLAYRRFVAAMPLSLAAVVAGCIGLALCLYSQSHGAFAYPMDADGADPRFYWLYAGVAVLVPFLFRLTNASRIDRELGELSYPLYLVHGFAILIANTTMSPSSFADINTFVMLKVALILTLSALMCVALRVLVDRPMDRLRARLTQRAGGKAIVDVATSGFEEPPHGMPGRVRPGQDHMLRDDVRLAVQIDRH